MPISIKNDEAHRLASRLAQLTGETLTDAVTRALRERLERLEASKDIARQLLDIGRDCAGRLNEPYKSIVHDDLLYDGRGLPR